MTKDSDSKACPRCGLGLRQTAYEGISLDACDGCWGFWLDQGELEAVLAARDQNFNRQERERILMNLHQRVYRREEDSAIPCPVCRAAMEKKELVPKCGLLMDICPSHGIWLDTGELKAAQVYAEQTGALGFVLREIRMNH